MSETLKPGHVRDYVPEVRSLLRVVNPDGKCFQIYLVFGNSPGELVSDYLTGCPVMEAVIDSEAAKWEKREQPTRFCQATADREAFNARAAAHAARGNDCSVPLADRIKQRGAR